MPHFVVTADTGSGHSEQYKVAESIERLTHKYPIHSVLLLGDNIYEEGVTSVDDMQFKTKFEDPYQKIHKPFYLCLGNHDYGNSLFLKKNSDYQIEYSKFSKKWNMPSRYYSFSKGPCEFFFIDTNLDVMSESSIMHQLNYMTELIQKSNKKWKILCGHHPWRSVGGHGNADRRLESFFNDLAKSKFDLYMCGHDHCKNIILKKFNNRDITLLVIGTGGKKYHGGDNGRPRLQNMKENESDLLFHSPNLGACHIIATPKRLKLVCYNEELKEEFTHVIRK